MRILAIAAANLLATAAILVLGQTANQLYLITNRLCLTLAQDQTTVVLAGCGQFGYQQWDISSGERIQLGGYCLDAFPGPTGALQIKPCSGALSQSWWFSQDGRITNKAQTSGCLSTQGTNGATLFLGACSAQSPQFFSSQSPPSSMVAPQLPVYAPQQPSLPGLPSYGAPQAAPQLPPMMPQVQQTVPQLPPPITNSFQPSLPPPVQQMPPPLQQTEQQYAPPVYQQQPPAQTTQQTVSQQIQELQRQQEPVDLSQDHYLCTCIVDANAESCTSAVRAACTVGHLDPHACRSSFSKGDHDKIADDILRIIENGAKCASFDPKTLKAEAQRRPVDLPKNAFSSPGDGMPTAEDHYLCVCLDSKSSEKCLAAVKAACLVGHIPSGDCQASLSRNNHDGATDHILRLINQGASCSQTLKTSQLSHNEAPKSSPGIFSRMVGHGSKSITKSDRALCACLDDPNSALCGNAIKQACAAKRIPTEDCQVAENRHYLGGVTKHALKLIDHGAECPAHRAMTFTNHGCHCLQSWSEGGKSFTFPNNCADPGGRKGYAWCKTFASEHCAGVEGAIEWDRCDNPKFPVRRDEAEVDGDGSTKDGELGEEDHYLCICLSQTSTDEVCVAAVKAACAVGHLPQAACRASFESNEHGVVSDLVVQTLQGGKRCQQTLAESRDRYQPKEGETECPEGFFGFPNCKRKVECTQKCGYGQECDFEDGTCVCQPNFTGPTCSHCADGYSGRYCTPDGQGGGWTLGQGLVYLFLFAGLMYAGFTAYKRFGGETSMGITYSKVPTAQPADELGQPDTGLSGEDDGVAMSSDLGSDIEANPEPAKPKHVHTGLAV